MNLITRHQALRIAASLTDHTGWWCVKSPDGSKVLRIHNIESSCTLAHSTTSIEWMLSALPTCSLLSTPQ
jgi:hypothetical protein